MQEVLVTETEVLSADFKISEPESKWHITLLEAFKA